eukprot:TRINITY_DN45020_c0_g1_i3.p1 TRINITY_DN45020_c0_g1~~TRINITY_DN45020_c0_g1_i3.p1  ORF type:complete len:100 (-),score=9.90 TRINITY_DN45020_c0_g1_i3:260-559(-)
METSTLPVLPTARPRRPRSLASALPRPVVLMLAVFVALSAWNMSARSTDVQPLAAGGFISRGIRRFLRKRLGESRKYYDGEDEKRQRRRPVSRRGGRRR